MFWRGKFEDIDSAPDHLMLHRAAIKKMAAIVRLSHFSSIRLSTMADAPVGSGLGTSSTVVVSIIQGLSELLGVPLGEYDLAHLAFEVERIDCKLSGGGQDHYAAAFGGVNFMEFYADNRVIVNPLRIRDSTMFDLEASLVLYFTGVSRQSAEIINSQMNNVLNSDIDAIGAMHDVKKEAVSMKEALLFGDMEKLADSLKSGWAAKKRMAFSISNNDIDTVYDSALASGALAGKISGAGGSGFMMFIVDPSKRIQVIRCLEKAGGQVFPCGFSDRGAIAWRS